MLAIATNLDQNIKPLPVIWIQFLMSLSPFWIEILETLLVIAAAIFWRRISFFVILRGLKGEFWKKEIYFGNHQIQQYWVAFMSQAYWVEVMVEVELRLIWRLKLSWGWLELGFNLRLRLSFGWGWVEAEVEIDSWLGLSWGWVDVVLRLNWGRVEIELELK